MKSDAEQEVEPPAERTVIDYLNTPPQRYTTDKEFGMVPHQQGEWVRFEDMDLYMLEGGGYMRRMLEERQALDRLCVHLTSGSHDPNAKLYSKRDVEALIAVAIAAREAAKNARK